MQERAVAFVGGRDLVQVGLGDLDRGHLAGGDPGGQRGRVGSDQLAHWLSPRICGTAKRSSAARGAAASASAWVRPGDHLVGPGHVDGLERIVGGLDAGDVDGLNRADMGQDRIELAGEAVQLGIGQRQPGQPGQVGYVVTGDLGHDWQA